MLSYTIFIALCAVVLQIHANIGASSCINNSSCKYTSSPHHIRIALRGPTGVTLSWRTNGTSNGSNDTPIPTVEYSTNITFANSTFSYGDSNNYINRTHTSWFHNCALNVTPAQIYYYRILRCLCVNGSRTYTFTAQPVAGSQKPINVTIFADLGAGDILNWNASDDTIAALTKASDTTDFFLHIGDISYADDHLAETTLYEHTWNMFQRKMQIITARKFYMTAPGNHEVTCNQAYGDDYCQNNTNFHPYRNFTAYLHRFRMPGDESNGFKNLWYSFDYGLAHFVIITTETDFPGAPSGPNSTWNGGNFATNVTQLEWLANDLEVANNNRNKTPWVIVAGHRPLYTSIPFAVSPDHARCNACRDAFADLFFNNSVDFYFAGHVHWLERLYPVDRNGEPLALDYNNRSGPIYVTTGAAGAPEPIQIENPLNKINASATILPYYGYSKLAIKNSTYCQLYFYDSTNNSFIDVVNITRFH